MMYYFLLLDFNSTLLNSFNLRNDLILLQYGVKLFFYS